MVKLLLWALVAVLGKGVNGFFEKNEIELFYSENQFDYFNESKAKSNYLWVGLTLIKGAAATGAVCLDGTLPGYHLHRGFGSGANSWLIHFEGGGWCNNIRTCNYKKNSNRGSSKYMEKMLAFTGILSNKPQENPDFFNWNRVKLRYCDGASFSGDGEIKTAQLQFRGEQIFRAGIRDLMLKGMKNAKQALLSGCSAGGLSSILHCDEFRSFFPRKTIVKCLSDGGRFLDVVDVSGVRTQRNLYTGVVNFQGVKRNLPRTCTDHIDPTSCFFPQNIIGNIKTPLFILNPGYDIFQIMSSLAPPSADPHGYWAECRINHTKCSASQIQILQETKCSGQSEVFRCLNGLDRELDNNFRIVFVFDPFHFSNFHCQSEKQNTWFADISPVTGNKAIATAVGDWYFDRASVKLIDCPYPCYTCRGKR